MLRYTAIDVASTRTKRSVAHPDAATTSSVAASPMMMVEVVLSPKTNVVVVAEDRFLNRRVTSSPSVVRQSAMVEVAVGNVVVPTVNACGSKFTNPPSHATAAEMEVVAAAVSVEDAPVHTGDRMRLSPVAVNAPDCVNAPEMATVPDIVEVPEIRMPPAPYTVSCVVPAAFFTTKALSDDVSG